MNKYKSNKHTIFNLGFHIIWCSKYRIEVLKEKIEDRLKELILNKCKEKGWDIDKMEVMPDHVHVFIKTKPKDSPSFIANQLKGYTSNILRKEFKELRTKMPTLWSRSYFVESVGNISESTIKKYIENQKKR